MPTVCQAPGSPEAGRNRVSGAETPACSLAGCRPWPKCPPRGPRPGLRSFSHSTCRWPPPATPRVWRGGHRLCESGGWGVHLQCRGRGQRERLFRRNWAWMNPERDPGQGRREGPGFPQRNRARSPAGLLLSRSSQPATNHSPQTRLPLEPSGVQAVSNVSGGLRYLKSFQL